MKTFVSTFFLLCVLSGCQQASVLSEPSTSQSISQDLSEVRKGQEAALENIERGILGFNSPGRPGPGAFDYARIFKVRYGVEVSLESRGHSPTYLSAYSRVMKEEIIRRFGDTVFDKVWAEVALLIRQCQATPQNRQSCSPE